MQFYVIEPPTQYNDILNSYVKPNKFDQRFKNFYKVVKPSYLTDNNKEPDLVIRSAHSFFYSEYSDANTIVVVVSYVPHQRSNQFLSFYSALWGANTVACDSYVYSQLKSLGEVVTRMTWVNLDGTSPKAQSNWDPETADDVDTDAVKVHIHAEDAGNLQDKFKEYIKDENSFVRATTNLTFDSYVEDADAILSLTPVSPSLTNYWLHNKLFVWVPSIEDHGLYIDCRCNYGMLRQQQLRGVSDLKGAAAGKVMREAFDVFTEEFVTLLLNVISNKIEPHFANDSIPDRIFNELNRSK